MKNHAQAQAILLYSGHPLEPIVAKELQKSFENDQAAAARRQALLSHLMVLQASGAMYVYDNNDADWFANYE